MLDMQSRRCGMRQEDGTNQRWAFGALAAYIVMLVINALGASTLLLGGVNTAAVSDSYPNLFAPSGVTFSIWGLIYLLLGVFFFRAFAIWRTKKPAVDNKSLRRIVMLFTLSSVLNTTWMIAWQYKVMWLSVLLMLGLLYVLITIQNELRDKSYMWQEYALTRLPFSIYFGWITVATIANITTFLVSVGWHGGGISEGTWMVAVLLVGAAIGIATAYRNLGPAYLAVFVWAYAGILLKHLSPQGFDGKHPATIVALSILLAVFISTVFMLSERLYKEKKLVA